MSLREVVTHANNIDRLVQNEFRKHGIEQNPPSTDEQFIRRLYLDILGRIPSYPEVTEFLDSKEPGKRRSKIEELLLHPGYVAHNYNYWPMSSASAHANVTGTAVPTLSGSSKPSAKTNPTTFSSKNS